MQSLWRNLVFLTRYLSLTLFLPPGYVPDSLGKVTVASDDMYFWIWKNKNRNWEIKTQAQRWSHLSELTGEDGAKVTSQDTCLMFPFTQDLEHRIPTHLHNQEATRIVQNSNFPDS